MTPAQWKKLAVAVAERSVTCGPVPGLGARSVLQAMLFRLAGGANFKTRKEAGAAVALGERALRAAFDELASLSFTMPVRNPEDARSGVPYVNEAMVKAWVKGDYTPAGGSENSLQNAGYFGPDSLQNAGFPRVRAAMSSSSSSFSSTEATQPETAEEAYAQQAAMLAALKHWQFSVSGPGAKDVVWGWVGLYTVDQVFAAAEAAWRAGSRAPAYVETVLQDKASRAMYPGSVRNFEDYRSLRPWHGAPKVDDEENA